METCFAYSKIPQDMAVRILAAWYLVGQDQGYPETNIYSWNFTDPRNEQVNVQDDHAKYVLSV